MLHDGVCARMVGSFMCVCVVVVVDWKGPGASSHHAKHYSASGSCRPAPNTSAFTTAALQTHLLCVNET